MKNVDSRTIRSTFFLRHARARLFFLYIHTRVRTYASVDDNERRESCKNSVWVQRVNEREKEREILCNCYRIAMRFLSIESRSSTWYRINSVVIVSAMRPFATASERPTFWQTPFSLVCEERSDRPLAGRLAERIVAPNNTVALQRRKLF